MTKLKIAVAVQGRINAFELAEALMARGHEVKLFTNYPKWAVKKFGIKKKHVVSFWPHGILVRCCEFFHHKLNIYFPEAFIHKLFGHWAAHVLAFERWDVIYIFSGIAEETIKKRVRGGYKSEPLIMLIRASSHIITQNQILRDESERTRCFIERPSQWMMDREMREYSGVDFIRVISGFCLKSFLDQGVNDEKVKLILSADPVQHFKPDFSVIEKRCKSISEGKPLRIIFVGTLCYRKGLFDLKSIVDALKLKMRFRFVGPSNPKEFSKVAKYFDGVEIVGKVKHHDIVNYLNESDIFIFPTLEEGYAQVLGQAMANGLPVITTTNCQGPDVIMHNQNGWILPVRSSEEFIRQLLWCDQHRVELCQIVRNAYSKFKSRTFNDVARDIEEFVINKLQIR